MAVLTCFNCNGSLHDVVLPFSRRADCPHCRVELHCCLMCTQFDARIKEQCREDRAEPPTRKDVANFCEWFTPAAGRSAAMTAAQRAQAHLDSLFDAAPDSKAARDDAAVEGQDSRDAATDAASDSASDTVPGTVSDTVSGTVSDTTPEEPLSPEERARRRLDDLFR